MRWLQVIGSLFSSGGLPGGVSLWSPSWQAAAAMVGLGRTSQAGEVVNVATAGALPAVYRACSFIADALSSVPLCITQEQPTGGKVEVEDSDAARALDDWSYADRECFVYHAALGGNGLAIVRRNSRGGVSGFHPIVPRRVTALRDEAGEIWFSIIPLPNSGTAEPEIIAADDMLHLKFRNIGDQIGQTVFGIPPIVTAAEALGLILAARSFQAALWRNGSVPVGVLEVPTILKPEVVERFRTQFDEAYRGTGRGRTVVLEQDTKWKDVKPSITAADAQLIEVNQFGVNEIARLYGVPPSLLSQTHHASYSTSVEESRAAVLHCLRPWSERLCDVLGRKLLTRAERSKGMRVEADLSAWLVAPGTETATYLAALVNAGILNLNESRNYLGFPDVQGGDVHRVPVNSTALANLPRIGLNKPTPQEPPQ